MTTLANREGPARYLYTVTRMPINFPWPRASGYNEATEQVVEVAGHAYRWVGSPPLKLGDLVMLPENPISKLRNGPGPFIEMVDRLGSAYDGEMTYVLYRVDRPAKD